MSILITETCGKFNWYLLQAPKSVFGQHFGVADSRSGAYEAAKRIFSAASA